MVKKNKILCKVQTMWIYKKGKPSEQNSRREKLIFKNALILSIWYRPTVLQVFPNPEWVWGGSPEDRQWHKKIGVGMLCPFQLKTSISINLFYSEMPTGYKNMTENTGRHNGKKNLGWVLGWSEKKIEKSVVLKTCQIC